MKKFRFPALAALVAVALALGTQTTTFAQTALYATTLNAAVSEPSQGNPQTRINLVSGTNVAVGQGLVIDGEYMTIQSAVSGSTTLWNVSRGQSGTTGSPHVNGSAVLFGAPNNFYFDSRQVMGACTSTAQTATPRVVVGGRQQTSLYLCPAVNTLAGSAAAQWTTIILNGSVITQSSRYTGWTYLTAGALTIQSGTQLIGSAGALAMTLVAPDKYMDGVVMVLQASTAQAHTVTYIPGFLGTGAASDVATFGGAIGDQLVIYATNGAWRPLTVRNVTFG